MTGLGSDESPLQKCLCLPEFREPDNFLRRHKTHQWHADIKTGQDQMQTAVWHSPHPHSSFLKRLCNTRASVAINYRFEVTQENKNYKQVLKHTNPPGLFLGKIPLLTVIQKDFKKSLTILFNCFGERPKCTYWCSLARVSVVFLFAHGVAIQIVFWEVLL